MTNSFNRKIVDVIIRRPLRPASNYFELLEILDNTDKTSLIERFRNDRKFVIALKHTNLAVYNLLFSSSLITDNELLMTLVGYYARSCIRSTPMNLFSVQSVTSMAVDRVQEGEISLQKDTARFYSCETYKSKSNSYNKSKLSLMSDSEKIWINPTLFRHDQEVIIYINGEVHERKSYKLNGLLKTIMEINPDGLKLSSLLEKLSASLSIEDLEIIKDALKDLIAKEILITNQFPRFDVRVSHGIPLNDLDGTNSNSYYHITEKSKVTKGAISIKKLDILFAYLYDKQSRPLNFFTQVKNYLVEVLQTDHARLVDLMDPVHGIDLHRFKAEDKNVFDVNVKYVRPELEEVNIRSSVNDFVNAAGGDITKHTYISMGSFIKHSEKKFWVKGFWKSANALINRNCWDEGFEELARNVQKRLQQEYETARQTELVEVVYNFSGRFSDILERQIFTHRYIPFATNYLADRSKRAIKISDLEVRIEGNRLILVDQKTNRRIHPIFSSPLNTSLSGLSPICIFLSRFQFINDGQTNFHWSWGKYNNLQRLPRVTFDSWVLKPRTWKWRLTESEELRLISLKKVKDWLDENDVPEYVYFGFEDRQIVISTKIKFFQNMIFKELRNSRPIIMTEYFDQSSHIRMDDGSWHCNEILVPSI